MAAGRAGAIIVEDGEDGAVEVHMAPRSLQGRTPSRIQRGSRSSRTPPVARKFRYADGSLCIRCGALFRKKTWRRRPIDVPTLENAPRTTCPACRQVRRGEFHGQVRLRARLSAERRSEIVGRIRHVLRRAAFTQPERRLVALRVDEEGLELTTTSQKLAHRIAHELAKAFGGRVRYSWSDREPALRADGEIGP